MRMTAWVVSLAVIAGLTSASATEVATSGSWDGSGKNLNNYFSTWGVGLDVNSGQLAADAYWNDKLGGDSSALMVLEVAGHANGNSFGVFSRDAGGAISRVQLFDGAATAGASVTFAVPVGQFGFYLGYNGTYFYSDPELNDGKADQMVAYRGPIGGGTLNIDKGLSWDASSYLLAWEDLPYGSSDKDFNDMVLLVHSGRVPDAGATVVLLGLALFSMSLLRSRSGA